MPSIYISEKDNVAAELGNRNTLAENGDNEAARELNETWINFEKLKTVNPHSLVQKDFTRRISLNIKAVSTNRYCLMIGLKAYIFAFHSNSDYYVFLTVCQRGLESNDLVLAKADFCFEQEETILNGN